MEVVDLIQFSQFDGNLMAIGQYLLRVEFCFLRQPPKYSGAFDEKSSLQHESTWTVTEIENLESSLLWTA
jgi:hypothetical protein